jgi:hypothetical protein
MSEFLSGAIGKGAGITGSMVGGVLDSVATMKRMKLAKKQQEEGKIVGANRLASYNKTYGDLMSMVEGSPTFKADLSGYDKMIAEAERQKVEANQMPQDALYREDVRQTTANTIQSARAGARSATDLMSIAGMAGNNEAKSMRAINADSRRLQEERGLRAGGNKLNVLGMKAGAMANAKAMEFDSQEMRRNSLLGLTKEQGLGMADMQYGNSQEQFARQAALTESMASLWSGLGDTARSIGSGIANQKMQQNQMNMWRSMYPTPAQSVPASPVESVSGKWGGPSYIAANGFDLRSLVSPKGFPTDLGADGKYIYKN